MKMREKFLTFVFFFHLPCLMDSADAGYGHDFISEAVFESYLPLISHFRNMEHSTGTIPVNLTVSPVFIEMASRGSFRKRFERYMDNFARTIADDMKFFAERGKKRLVGAAEYWLDRVDEMISLFNGIDGDIVSELGKLGRKGLELMATTATSDCLQLISSDAGARAQIRLGLKSFEETFGYTPHGFWLPFARHRSGIQHGGGFKGIREGAVGTSEVLADAGIEYYIAQSQHTPALVRLKPGMDLFRRKPVLTDLSGDHAFETGISDITRQQGMMTGGETARAFAFNGERAELIFIGEDAQKNAPEYLNTERRTFPGGNRYWSNLEVHDQLDESEAYEKEKAVERASEQTAILLRTIHSEIIGKDSGLLIAPFDTIISGEPWHEAPFWIEKLFLNIGNSGVKAITISDYLKTHEQLIADTETDTGRYDEHLFPMFGDRHMESILGGLHEREARFETILAECVETCGTETGRRVLKQMARELLILQNTDLQLLITSNRHRAYAEKTVLHHLEQFDRLAEMSKCADPGEGMIRELETIEKNDSIFQSIDLALWK
jgi:1,4-alpha-glucan branching enzyme